MALTAADLVAEAKQHIRELEPKTAREWLGSARILDVREPAEYAAGHLPGAVNIPRGVLEFKVDAHPAFQDDKSAPILVYCQTGGRSALATHALLKLGYEGATSLAGGFSSWLDQGGITEKPA
ncbi:MAG TPA: rhodanese-like domain-containing protein [Methylococcaceae bacterium]|nr:rhodanese-like domain-containing protein [Methylococcaceae bacterium]